jgi:hypothetical protein
MNKKLLWALLLIAVAAIILILNTSGRVSITVLPGVTFEWIRSIAFLVFISAGVAIGLLLK